VSVSFTSFPSVLACLRSHSVLFLIVPFLHLFLSPFLPRFLPSVLYLLPIPPPLPPSSLFLDPALTVQRSFGRRRPFLRVT
jgi:hypothetical protein